MTLAITRPLAGPLDRFLAAQNRQGTYIRARNEIVAGRKRTHWMWFVFPQLAALAKSETARYYGIADKDQAAAYIENTTLRARLGECTMHVLRHDRLMFHRPDDGKLHACMTLFREVVADPTAPNAVLDKFYGGKPHQLTLDVLAGRYVAPQTTTGRVEVGRHWDKQISVAQANVAAAGARRPRTEPMMRAEVASFVAGFNLSAAATRRLVDEWMADQDRARQTGWDAHADAAWYDES